MKRKEIEQRQKKGHHNHKTQLVAGGNGNRKRRKEKPGIHTEIKKQKQKQITRQEKKKAGPALHRLVCYTKLQLLSFFVSVRQPKNII